MNNKEKVINRLEGKPECKSCDSRGLLISFNSERGHLEIQRCDICQQFNSDTEAWEFIKPIDTESDKRKVVNRLEDKTYGRYIFPITLSGYGKTPDEAWEESIDGFSQEPGEYPEDYNFEEEDE